MVSSISEPVSALPRTQDEWRAALAALPATTSSGIPVFYFAHGSPMLAMNEPEHPRFGRGGATTDMGPNGANGRFLKDFGPALLEKYKPKGIVVFSAHWDAPGDRLGANRVYSVPTRGLI
jgi:aromatic ring-opening dioxygenase catalytic subunit (LigB family)